MARNTVGTQINGAMGVANNAVSQGIGMANTALDAAASTASLVGGVAGAVREFAANPSSIVSAIRSMNVPLGGIASIFATVTFGGPGTSDDWRVRISVPSNFFASSPILKPLVASGGLVFPYTPQINISHSASYEDVGITHQNYQFLAYQNSKMQEIQISGPFNVEDAVQAQYWIAAVHFLRAVTKMYTGDTAEQGSPPPIVTLNGYGNHVFNNVPVVVKSFNIDMPQDCDYIKTQVSGGVDHVPVKSTLTVTLQPIYSREAVRNFSLQKFVNGGYMKSGGYI